MNCKVVRQTSIQSKGPNALICIVGTSNLDAAIESLGHRMRNTAGMDINHTANRTCSIEQRAGTFEHFDALCHERVDRSGMIRT